MVGLGGSAELRRISGHEELSGMKVGAEDEDEGLGEEMGEDCLDSRRCVKVWVASSRDRLCLRVAFRLSHPEARKIGGVREGKLGAHGVAEGKACRGGRGGAREVEISDGNGV